MILATVKALGETATLDDQFKWSGGERLVFTFSIEFNPATTYHPADGIPQAYAQVIAQKAAEAYGGTCELTPLPDSLFQGDDRIY